jgi:hypothetical protein
MRHTMLLLSVILLGGAGVYGQSSNASPAPTSGRKHLSLAEANDIALSGFEETSRQLAWRFRAPTLKALKCFQPK